MKSYNAPKFDHSEIGKEFGRLTLLGPWFVVRDGKLRSQRVAVCKCQCGKITTARKEDVHHGKKTSCGCYRIETATARSRANAKHGQSRSRTKSGTKRETREYNCWSGMIQRCENQNHIGYASYGGRGITICDRWRESFAAFFEDMGTKPSSDHSIDRIDVNGNYEPTNCRWANRIEQERNKTTNRVIVLNGQSRSVSEWAEITGIPAQTIYKRLNRGMPPHDALTMPVDQEMSRRTRRAS